MTNRRAKKSSVRRNSKAYKKVDPFWQENPHKLKAKEENYKKLQAKKPQNLTSRNKRLREIAIKSLVKKHGKEENERVYKEEEEKRKNKFKYVQAPGETEKQFKQRMQDDVDMIIAEAQMTKKMKSHQKIGLNQKKEVSSTGAPDLANNEDFQQIIRNELIEQGKIKPRKLDLLKMKEAKEGSMKTAKQHQNYVKKTEKNLKKLDKQLEKEEKEAYTDKVAFGEVNHDIFRPKALPKGVKKQLQKEKLLAKLSGNSNKPVRKKNNGLQFLNETQSKNSQASEGLYKKSMILNERKKAIEQYRAQRKDKLKI